MIAHLAWTATTLASLQIAPTSLTWFARRSNSAMMPRSMWARAGTRPAQCVFHGLRECETIGDCAVPGNARGDFCRLIDRSARTERLYALVHIAEPLFEAGDGLAVGCKAEMARLDNAGVNRADGNLMQTHAFNGQEFVPLFGSRRPAWPHAMVEPGAVIGEPDGICAVKIAHRPFQPHRRRMMPPYRRVSAIARLKREDGAAPSLGFRQSHVHSAVVEPKRAEVVPACGAPLAKARPERFRRLKARIAVRPDIAVVYCIGERDGVRLYSWVICVFHPSNSAARWNPDTKAAGR